MAPRWKMATRIFLRRAGASAAYKARESHAGAAPMPNIATADDFRNNLREVMTSSPLEIGRAQHQAGDQAGIRRLRFGGLLVLFGLRRRERFRNRVQRLGRRIAEQNLPGGG